MSMSISSPFPFPMSVSSPFLSPPFDEASCVPLWPESTGGEEECFRLLSSALSLGVCLLLLAGAGEASREDDRRRPAAAREDFGEDVEAIVDLRRYPTDAWRDAQRSEDDEVVEPSLIRSTHFGPVQRLHPLHFQTQLPSHQNAGSWRNMCLSLSSLSYWA